MSEVGQAAEKDAPAYDHDLPCRDCGPGYRIGGEGCRHGSAYKPADGETGVCRTCLEPITWRTRTDPGYLPRTGWRDGLHVDQLICYAAVNYRHVPLGGREAAIYKRAYERGQKEAHRD